MANLINLQAVRGRARSVRVMRPSERSRLSRSATRALDVLEYFGEVRRPLRAIDIARMLGLRPSTADQLLKTMVGSAHLVFEAQTKTYLPSLRLMGISSWIIETYGADHGLRELVRDVQRRTGMSVTLTTPNDLFMQIIDMAMPEEQQAERGLRISVFGSTIGSAYLSSLDDDTIIRLAHRARIAPDEMPAIIKAVNSIRLDGFVQGPTGEEMWSIAVPLLQRGARLPMVLGLAGPAVQVVPAREELQGIMRQALENWRALNRK